MASAHATLEVPSTADALFKVLQDRAKRSLHYTAVRELRALAVKGALDKKNCARLLRLAEEISAREADDEILMDVIGSVASSSVASEVLPPFIERCVDDDDRRWFGFFAVGSLVNRQASGYSDSFLRTIVSAAMEEPDAERRTRYLELAGNILLYGRRVWIVDPDVGFARFAEKQLRDKGVVVELASSEAPLELQSIDREPDVWLVELNLVDGIRERGNKAPIVGVTGHDLTEAEKKQPGVRIMLKPVKPAHLRLALANEIFHHDLARWYSSKANNLLDLAAD